VLLVVLDLVLEALHEGLLRGALVVDAEAVERAGREPEQQRLVLVRTHLLGGVLHERVDLLFGEGRLGLLGRRGRRGGSSSATGFGAVLAVPGLSPSFLSPSFLSALSPSFLSFLSPSFFLSSSSSFEAFSSFDLSPQAGTPTASAHRIASQRSFHGARRLHLFFCVCNGVLIDF
jgi:hypothetical protein